MLFCPTGTGAFVAVDPLTRACRWIARFPRGDVPAIRPGEWLLFHPSEAAPTDRWWNGRPEARVIVEDQTVRWISPESDHWRAASIGEGAWRLEHPN